MNKTVTISTKALVLGSLFSVLLFIGAIKIISIEKSIDNAQLIFQVQQNSQNIQALDKAIGELAKQIEELKKLK